MSWRPAGVPQGLILGLSPLLMYIKDLLNKLKSNAKLFANETRRFIVVKNKNERANALNNDLLLISKWDYNWKMLFYPDPSKTTQQELFSRKKPKSKVYD